MLRTIIVLFGGLHYVSGACPNNGTDARGIEISGETVDCKYLQYPRLDDYHNVYTNRVQLCQQSPDGCCKTCNTVLTCRDKQLYLVGTYYDCKLLRTNDPAHRRIGIFASRRRLCNNAMHYNQCCESCQLVKTGRVKAGTGSKRPTVKLPSTSKTNVITERPRVYHDTCSNSCLWIGDGTIGSCDWLTNSSNGVYERRLYLCNHGLAPGCKRTCHNIKLDSKTNQVVDDTSKSACVDIHVLVDKHSVSCKALQRSTTTVYSRRYTLCKAKDTVCCKTCKLIEQEHLYTVGNPDGFNSVNSLSGATNSSVQTNNEVAKSIQSFLQVYQIIAMKAQQEERERQESFNKFGSLMNQMFASMFHMFKRKSNT